MVRKDKSMAEDEFKDDTPERSDIKIEGNVAVWELKSQGDINGTYIGVFKFKCYLDPMEQIKANREYREMLGLNPLTAPEHESWLAYALTQLKYRVVSAPPFWTSTLDVSGVPGNIPDENILGEVLSAATDAEVKYRNQLKKRKLSALDRAKKAAERLLQDQVSEDKEGEDESES